MALTYSGLAALGVPDDALRSFPEAFRVGMAGRARELGDYGANDPSRWEPEFGSAAIHIGVSVFSASEQAWRRTMDTAHRCYEGRAGLAVLMAEDFGAQPGESEPARVPGLDRPARHRGQRRRAAARAGAGDQSR